MQMEKINQKKLRVMLSERDLQFYSVSHSDIYGIDKKGSDTLRLLLKEAALRTGFEATEENISIVIKTLFDGYEIYITKTTSKEEESDYDIYFLPSWLEVTMLCNRLLGKDREFCVWYGEAGLFIGFLVGESPYYMGDYGETVGGELKAYVFEYCKTVYSTKKRLVPTVNKNM